ncbi:MAG: hypothetical protein PVH88_27385 [Ignavibacteria bacterium]|jgi:hypothetical protein
MKFLRLLLIILFCSSLLFSQPNYPVITYEELENIEYTILEEHDGYSYVEVDGVIYIVYE